LARSKRGGEFVNFLPAIDDDERVAHWRFGARPDGWTMGAG
jgi:hypothetical protein